VGSRAGALNGLTPEELRDASVESESDALSAIESTGDIAETTSLVSSSGETHEIQMRNQGSDGVMVFEPSVLRVQVGDSVTFKATDAGHNSASIEGMIPSEAEPWDGGMGQDVTITLTEEGTYVYQCTPHLMMAMVGVITVGDLNKNLEEIETVAAEKKSEFVMEQGRLDSYLQNLR
jgi:pseudoazurin